MTGKNPMGWGFSPSHLVFLKKGVENQAGGVDFFRPPIYNRTICKKRSVPE